MRAHVKEIRLIRWGTLGVAAKVSSHLLLIILFGGAILNAQTNEPQNTPDLVVNRFCAQDLSGKRLSQVSARDLAHSLLITETLWDQPTEALIVKYYSARSLRIQKDTAEFAVEYRVLGRIDSALRLTRLQMPYTNQPDLQSERLFTGVIGHALRTGTRRTLANCQRRA